jgi:hypothetical protein
MNTQYASQPRGKFYRLVGAAIYISLAGLAMSCASNERRVSDVVVYPNASENPSDEIAKLSSEIENAKTRNVPLLAPTWFASAEKSLKEARTSQNESGDFRTLFKRVAEGRVQIQRANEIAETSQKVVRDVLKARETANQTVQDAVRAGATNLDDIRKSLAAADEQFVEITKSVEDGKLDNMLDRRQAAIKGYAAVEAKALRKGKLDTAKRVLDEAIAQGAKKYAPKSLGYAQEVIGSTEQLISSNPKAELDIDKKSDESLFFARRALLFTQQARDISSRSPEDTVLWVEQGIGRIAEEAGAPDLRDEKLDNQIDSLRAKIGDIKSTAANAVAAAQASATPKKAVRASGKAPAKTKKM